jgi:hypothetical protein
MSYGKSDLLAVANTTTIGNVELDVLAITDGASLKDSQLNIYLKGVLGASTAISVRYYCRAEVGGDWYLLPYKNETSGDLENLPSILKSGVLQAVDSVPLPACVAFKVTVQGNNATATAELNVRVMSRDN